MSISEIFEEMKKSIIEGNREEAARLAKRAIEEKLDFNEVIERGYIPGIQKVGELWEKGDYFLPELISGAEAMKEAMAVLEPELKKANIQTKSLGRVVIGTVEGDIHDIGKNLVASMLSAHGFEVIDLGADVKLERFIEVATAQKARFICLSALLTTTMTGQKKFLKMLEEKKLREKFLVLVGGAPVSKSWAEEIGADGYGENAMIAVKVAKELLKQ